jgi:hypothetical protein
MAGKGTSVKTMLNENEIHFQYQRPHETIPLITLIQLMQENGREVRPTDLVVQSVPSE